MHVSHLRSWNREQTVSSIRQLDVQAEARESPKIKEILNCLWGSLCERRKYSVSTVSDNDVVEIPEDAQVLSIIPVGKHTKVEYVKNESIYITPYGRIGPYVTSYARLMMSRLLYDHRQKIVKIHTDGIIITERIPELVVSPQLGKFKISNEGKVEIANKTRRPVWHPGKGQ